MKKRRVTKEPYEGYTLPKSAEKGEPFVDFHAVLDDMKIINRLKDRKRIIKKIKKREEYLSQPIIDGFGNFRVEWGEF